MARVDQTEGSARALLAGAGAASLLGAGYALHLAEQHSGASRPLLIVFGVVIVAGSVNLVSGLFR